MQIFYFYKQYGITLLVLCQRILCNIIRNKKLRLEVYVV